MISSKLKIWYDRKNSDTMCFPNSAYLLIHTNLVNTIHSFDQEVLSIDNIANYSGYSKETGVTLSPARLQNMSRKVNDSLARSSNSEIDFTLFLSSDPVESELKKRLQSGEVVLAGFSTGIYNKYFEKTGTKRPCVQSYETIGMDKQPPHYVSLIGIDKNHIAIIDPYCKYKTDNRLTPFSDFYINNITMITTMELKTFTSKILYYNMMDGIDRSNRELIYTDVIWKKGTKETTSSEKYENSMGKSDTGEVHSSFQKSIDDFSINESDQIGGRGDKNIV